jgi:hypothetical protein
MPSMNLKNTMLPGVAQDLGIGTGLPQQVSDGLDEEEKRRKLMGQSSSSAAARDLGMAALAPAGASGNMGTAMFQTR